MRLPLESLVYDLPDDITKARYAGDFAHALALIDARLQKENITPMLRDRLIVEKELIKKLPRRYTFTREEAIESGKKRIDGFTAEEFDECERNGDIDYIYMNGEKRYLSSCIGTLIKMHKRFHNRNTAVDNGDDDFSEKSRMEMMEKGELAYRFTLKHKVMVKDECFAPNQTYTAHLPVPAPAAQQDASKIKIECEPDGFLAAADAKQRTVAYRRFLPENKPFTVTYTFENRVKYVDPFKDAPHTVYSLVPVPTQDDVSEQAPHIVFTPYLKALAVEIAGDETRPLYLAKRVYDYVTQNVRYSFMRAYILIERQAEYAALNQKGDCGIQALLFITLCRILGVPARWQSGRTVDRGESGCHDWAQFYCPEFGWLFADPSYGGGAWRRGNLNRWAFYFGNLDPFRMIANCRYYTRFTPEKLHERFDPYDNQDGEVENEERGFDTWEFYGDADVLAFEKVE